MISPGVWVFGSTDDDERAKGMGVVVEYAGHRGAAQWSKPPDVKWDYKAFGNDGPIASPDHFELGSVRFWRDCGPHWALLERHL
jgi:hypothetical protein